MSSVDDCVTIQKQQGILTAPTSSSSSSSSSSTTKTTKGPLATTDSTAATLQIALQNNTAAAKLYVNITGLDINNNNAVWLLQSDGQTGYHPSNPSADQQPLAADCSIEVGGPGSVRTVTVPQLAGARIWFSQNTPLTFLLNRGTSGPGLVEPSVTNTADANYALRWDFCEFTFNKTELFANISYVDFVSIPVALHLTSSDGSADQTVAGIPADGLETICEALQEQQRVDCGGWDQLVVQIKSASTGTQFLRALSPYCGMVINSSLFRDYFTSYVAAAWDAYTTKALTVDTQASWGTVTGQVDAATGLLTFSGIGSFAKPSTADIFSCSTGAFAAYATNTSAMGNLTARLSAALNRSTLASTAAQPSTASGYYQGAVTNHYARIVHAANLDGRGYAFPYDDVAPTNGADQSGAVASGSPSLFTVYIGGGSASGAATTSTARSMMSALSTPIKLRTLAPPGKHVLGRRQDTQQYQHQYQHQHQRRSLLPPPPPPPPSSAEANAIMAPFFGGSVDADEKQLLRQAVEAQAQQTPLMQTFAQLDLEKGASPAADKPGAAAAAAVPAPAGPPDLTMRLLCLLHRALVALWVATAAAGRAAWALVPRRVAAPVGRAAERVAACPPVAAAATGVASFVSCVASSAAASAVAAMLLRPLVVRTVLTGLVLLGTFAAAAATSSSGSSAVSPTVTAMVSGAAGWLEGLVAGAGGQSPQQAVTFLAQ